MKIIQTIIQLKFLTFIFLFILILYSFLDSIKIVIIFQFNKFLLISNISKIILILIYFFLI